MKQKVVSHMESTTPRQMRDEYLKRVSDLYKQIKKWAGEVDPTITHQENEINLTEEAVESYSAKELIVKHPDYKPIHLIPRGRWIIGAEGRIDMKSDLGTETLLYTSEGGPHVKIDTFTENGKILQQGKSHPIAKEVTEGWVLVQNKQLGLLPALDKDLFVKLLEVLGQ